LFVLSQLWKSVYRIYIFAYVNNNVNFSFKSKRLNKLNFDAPLMFMVNCVFLVWRRFLSKLFVVKRNIFILHTSFHLRKNGIWRLELSAFYNCLRTRFPQTHKKWSSLLPSEWIHQFCQKKSLRIIQLFD
jgi:hypothetical protein